MSSSSNPLLNISNLSVEYAFEAMKVKAVNNVSLTIPSQGYTLGVVGESGSGKTTLGMSIMRAIERPGRISTGKIEFQGKDVLKMSDSELRKYRWSDVSIVFQSAMNSLNPVKTISSPIIEILRDHTKISRSEARERALSLLKEMQVDPKRARAYPHEFSGGMKQRVVIALALALSPKLLIADEPTSALDVVVQKQILAMLRNEVKERHLSLIFITHEIPLLVDLVDNIAVMKSGEIVEMGPINKVLRDPLHPYTQMLLGTLLSMKTTKESVFAPASEPVKNGGRAPEACIYSDTCPYVFDRCKVEDPVLKEIEPGRWVACHKHN